MPSWKPRAAALVALASTATALYVLPNSNCAALCLGGNDETQAATEASIDTADIVCRDDDFSGEAAGIKFRNCIECLRNSEERDGQDSDVRWMLYNMRFALDTCLYDPDFQIHSPCIIKSGCEPLEPALEAGLDTPGEGTWDYCTAAGDVFSSRSHWGCVSCLHAGGVQTYMANFLQTLKAGCEQKPDPGAPIIMRGQIFSDEMLNITVHNITLPGEGGAGSNDITTGTIVGIAVGAALFVLGLAGLIWAYCRRKKKRQAMQAADQTPPPDRSNASSFTAINHSPYFRDQKVSPSLDHELQEKRFATNADYYDRVEDDVRAGRANPAYNQNPRSHQYGPDSSLPTHSAYNPRMMSRDTPSPIPSAHRRSHTTDAAALQAYALGASGSSSHSRSRSVTPEAGRPSADGNTMTVQGVTMNIPPPPPGPPPSSQNGHSKTPSISMPSVPRVKVPKQYSPPTIVVDAASPTGDDEASKHGHINVSAREVDPAR